MIPGGLNSDSSRKGYPGFTLTETLIGLAILMLILSGIFAGFLFSRRSISDTTDTASRSSMLLSLVKGIERFEQDCTIPYWSPVNPISHIDEHSVHYTNGDSILIEDSGVTFTLNEESYIVPTDFPMKLMEDESDPGIPGAALLELSINGTQYSLLITPESYPIGPAEHEE